MVEIAGIGKLKIIEVYESHDAQPLLFSCKNAASHLYLVVAVADKEFAETWLYAEISRARLNLVRSGTIDLYDAFAKVEGGLLLRVLISKDNQPPPMARPIQACKVHDSLLPLPGERLNVTVVKTQGGADDMR